MDLLKNISKLETLSGRLQDKKVFLRADFNVPIKNGVILDTFRIDSTLETLHFLKNEGAITIIVSHIETKDVDPSTLVPVYAYIQKRYPELVVSFCADFLNESAVNDVLSKTKSGEFVLFENIRNAKLAGMSEKDNDQGLAEYLKKFADVYINDAFAVSHRDHASVSALPKLFAKEDKVAGNQLHKEVIHLSQALVPIKPFACILSGAKFSTKLPLIQKYLEISDFMLIGGALFNNIAKSLGNSVGSSLVDTDVPYLDSLVKTEQFTSKVFIPEKVVIKDIANGNIRISAIDDIGSSESIQDIAVSSIETFIARVVEMNVKTILWNGPMGKYEDIAFTKGTISLAENIFSYVKNNHDVRAILGGGDTSSAIQEISGAVDESRIFISTGGGAMLEFLEKDGQLPGIVSLL